MQSVRIAAIPLLAALASPPAAATPLDAAFTETVFLSSPEVLKATSMAWAPDGSNRLFVTLKNGPIRIIKNGVLLPPFAQIAPLYDDSECGVLGITFDPDFLRNHYVYVFATVSSTEQQIIRFTDTNDVGTERTVVMAKLPTIGANHDGGGLGVGPDGKLYWSIGDQGSGAGSNGDLRTLAAKVGRANLDGSLPKDNPLEDGDGPINDYIWAAGFRNPFTLTFQPATGLLWVNVVGDVFEQSFIVHRADHGAWNAFENNQPSIYLSPVIAYRTNGIKTLVLQAMDGATREAGVTTFRTVQAHFLRLGEKISVTGNSDASLNGDFYVMGVPGPTSFTVAQPGAPARGGGGSVTTLLQGGCLTGGAFYDATQFPAPFRGNFFYGDFNSGRIMRATLDTTTNTVTSIDYWATDIPNITDIAVGPDSALYYVSHRGSVYRTTYNPAAQGLVVTPTNIWTAEGSSATVSVRLAMPVSQDVIVSVARSAGDATVGVASGSALTFSAANWNLPQAATLAIGRDGDAEDGVATLTVASGTMASQTVAVHVRDLDSPPLLLSPTLLTMNEGANGTFTVALGQQPAAPVTVYVTVSAGDPDVSVSSGRTLTFTSANWSAPQTVTLVAAEDADLTNDRTTISVTPASRASQSLEVTVSDNDAPAVDASADAAADVAAADTAAPSDVGGAGNADAGAPDAAADAPALPSDAGADVRDTGGLEAVADAPVDGPISGRDAAADLAGLADQSTDGCNCRVARAGGGSGSLPLVLGLALAAFWRRSRRRTRPTSSSATTRTP